MLIIGTAFRVSRASAQTPRAEVIDKKSAERSPAPEFDSSKPLRSHKQSPGSYESITCKRSEGRFQISL
ncbi:Putative Site-specific recombinase, phage integrase family (fragment) [Thiomonas arsenitoxydans]|uniref:Site-specific recombinase, phage integrase family n=1 Tax=Thiomonas arsenitoxydans (strain DSM 22701 / CIP 110005 / 3As) TaxID=426114 RepID=A0ABP1Z0M7_THIA3